MCSRELSFIYFFSLYKFRAGLAQLGKHVNIVQKVPSSSVARELPIYSHSADIRTDPGKTDRIHGSFIYKNDILFQGLFTLSKKK